MSNDPLVSSPLAGCLPCCVLNASTCSKTDSGNVLQWTDAREESRRKSTVLRVFNIPMKLVVFNEAWHVWTEAHAGAYWGGSVPQHLTT
jgi:hypothetical protein